MRAFLGGLLSVRPDIDLNSYAIVTLNHDNTLTFINPQISFTKTKLEGVVVLPGPGADWALAPHALASEIAEAPSAPCGSP